LIMFLALSLSVFAACNTSPAEKTARENAQIELAAAADYLYQLEKNVEVTATDYDLRPQIAIEGVVYPITWSVELAEADAGKVVLDTTGETPRIDVDTLTETEVKYALIATFSLELQVGDKTIVETYEKRFNRTLPAFKYTTFEEYAASKNGDNLFIKGYVSAIVSKSAGQTYNCIYVEDINHNGGYYIYSFADTSYDPAKNLSIGDVVRVNGNFELYSGTYELKSAVVEKLDEPSVTLQPADFTQIYASAASLSDAALAGPQAQYVKINGVTITGQDASNGYYKFKLAGKESYVRISSSTCPIPKAEQANFIAEHAEHFGWTANVEGVISVYNGDFYLTPVDANAFEYVSLPELDEAGEVAFEKANLTFIENITENGSYELQVAGLSYADVVIAWESNNACAVVEGGKLIVELPEEQTTIELTATLTSGSATDTLVFQVVVDAAPKGAYVHKPISAPVAGTFKIAMNTTPANGSVLYFDGTLNSKGALNTTDKAHKAVDVVVEVVEGGYALKVGEQYLEGYLNGTYKNLRLVSNAAVWTWKDEAKVFVFEIEGVNYYFGDRDRGGYANTTMALSDIKYITGENLSKVGVSQFPGLLGTLANADYCAEAITAPVAGTFKITMNTTPANGSVLYFDGTLNSKGALNTTDKLEKAVDVVVEVVEGGYALKVGEQYLEGYLNGTYKNLRLVSNAAVWTWNDEAKVFVFEIDGVNYYFG
ncbi:MAG: hypothetical protein J6R88_04155, partial [Clostridia bacterium]|nr:hypothetical protein [Clostridia bacterium]